MNKIEFVKEVNWESVFDEWRKLEADDPGWQRCAVKIKGWKDWESWRRFTAGQIGAEKRKWKLYKIINPNDSVPEFLVGPTESWQSHFPKNTPEDERTFSRLLEVTGHFNSHSKIESIIRNYPYKAQLIGCRFPDSRITCFEGHHRMAAITLAKKRGTPVPFTSPLIIAITEFSDQEKELLKKARARGSHYKR